MSGNYQSFWRSHNRPRAVATRHVLAHHTTPGSLAHIRQLMKILAEEAVRAGYTRPSYGFEAGEVEAIYQRCGEIEGTWFALHDGRIFSGLGDFCGTDHSRYS